jgi:hypothetical protein
MLKQADIIGISSITSTAPRAFQLAKRYRSMGIPVIMGGAAFNIPAGRKPEIR